MAKKEEILKKCQPAGTQLKHCVSKTNLRSKHARLKALKKRKLYKAAMKLNIRRGIRINKFHPGKNSWKVSSSDSADKSMLLPLQCVNIAQKDAFKKKVSKKCTSKLPRSKICLPASQKELVGYQELFQKVMDKSYENFQHDHLAQLHSDGSFKNESHKYLTSDISCKKTVKNRTKTNDRRISNIRRSVSSMFTKGFKSKDVTKTPNDKSHILQCIDVKTYKKIAKSMKCDHSGPLLYKPVCDLSSDTEYIEESYETEVLTPVKFASARISSDNEHNDLEMERGVTPPTAKFYAVTKNSYVIVLKHPSNFFIEGEIKICVWNGALKVLGHILTNASGEKSIIYSPAGYCKLSVKTVETDASSALRNIKSILLSRGLSSQKIQDIITNYNVNDCVALIERAPSPLATYLATHCSISLYPKCAGSNNERQFFEQEKILHCIFDFEGKFLTNHLVEPTEWDEIATYVAERSLGNDCGRVMICGGKSVGKSTLLRYLINKSLSRVQEVLCLDFDPGQTEFTVPGSVSVVRVRKPLLGPNFTHILQPERMVYIGDVDMSKCPDKYIRSVQHIFEYCVQQPEFNKMLWFINTMGFNKGIGVDLTTHLIKLLNPTDVVQIHSKLRQRNYPELLSPENVMTRNSALKHLLVNVPRHLNYNLHIIPSAAEEVHAEGISERGMSPKQSRNVMILAYLHSMLKPPRFSLIDIIPYKIPLSQLILGICHETVNYSELLCAMNANLVALCIVSDEEHVLQPENNEFPKVLTRPEGAHCLGYGVVRGIDIKEKLLYLITPLPEEQLQKVNCLLGGSVTLPTNMYMNSNTILGHVPYVMLGSGQATSNLMTRHIIPPVKQRSPHGVKMNPLHFSKGGRKSNNNHTK